MAAAFAFAFSVFFSRFFIYGKAERDQNTWYLIRSGHSRYMGEWRNNKPHGKGVKEFFNEGRGKSFAFGNFVNGVLEGHGIQIFEQDVEPMVPYYVGEFKQNEHDGAGEYYWGTGAFYKGDFKKSLFHGRGMLYSKVRDSTFIGEYENDEELSGVRIKGRAVS